jgi:membrane protease subunit (stomatin/prohibitin family)
MGLFDWIFGQFIDVIEWTDNSQDTMVYRFNRQGNEIKYGAKLTVRESQMAVFVNEGTIADILGPGIYELETKKRQKCILSVRNDL